MFSLAIRISRSMPFVLYNNGRSTPDMAMRRLKGTWTESGIVLDVRHFCSPARSTPARWAIRSELGIIMHLRGLRWVVFDTSPGMNRCSLSRWAPSGYQAFQLERLAGLESVLSQYSLSNYNSDSDCETADDQAGLEALPISKVQKTYIRSRYTMEIFLGNSKKIRFLGADVN